MKGMKNWHTEGFRLTSDAPNFPWRDACYIRVSPDGRVEYARGGRGVFDRLQPEDLLLATWHGQWRTDTFLVDNREVGMDVIWPPGEFPATCELQLERKRPGKPRVYCGKPTVRHSHYCEEHAIPKDLA